MKVVVASDSAVARSVACRRGLAPMREVDTRHFLFQEKLVGKETRLKTLCTNDNRSQAVTKPVAVPKLGGLVERQEDKDRAWWADVGLRAQLLIHWWFEPWILHRHHRVASATHRRAAQFSFPPSGGVVGVWGPLWILNRQFIDERRSMNGDFLV